MIFTILEIKLTEIKNGAVLPGMLPKGLCVGNCLAAVLSALKNKYNSEGAKYRTDTFPN